MADVSAIIRTNTTSCSVLVFIGTRTRIDVLVAAVKSISVSRLPNETDETVLPWPKRLVPVRVTAWKEERGEQIICDHKWLMYRILSSKPISV